MKNLKFDRGRFLQGVILFGFSVYLIKLLETGEMHLLVSPSIQLLLEVTLGLMIVMTFFALGTVFTSETVFVVDEEEEEISESELMDPHHSTQHKKNPELDLDSFNQPYRIRISLNNHIPNQVHDHDHAHDHAHDHSHNNVHDYGHDHDHRPKPRKGWILIAIPVVVGLTIPTQALGSSMLSSGLQSKIQIQKNFDLIREKQQKSQLSVTKSAPTQHVSSSSNPSQTSDAQSKNPDFVDISKMPTMTVPGGQLPPKPKPGADISLGDLFTNIFTAPQYYFNQSMKITGFVYHPPGWPTNRLILIRYMITCCVADANPIGLTVEMKDAAKYPNDTWMQIEGTLSARTIPDGDTLPPIGWYYGTEEKPVLLGKEAKVIPEPKDPYLYPPKTSGFAGGNP